MRLSLEWIKEVAAIEADAEETAHRLTMAGLEVEETAESALGAVLDIKVTPNRGDCLSVIGVARELAAAYNTIMKPPAFTASESAGAVSGITSVTIEDPDLCPRYAARIIQNVKMGESPSWMQERLTAAGMRPINNIVDITNYVMLEMGQPLHAFDFDTLRGGRIVVRRARSGETLTTLDGETRNLMPEMLVICDAERPVAVAGVMGGADTEIGEQTTTMLLESAHFAQLSVRRTARTLGMRTEASYRFERIVDPAGVVAAADRACQLIAELGAGEVIPGVIDVYPNPAPARAIAVRPARVSAMLGFEVSPEQTHDALSRLGFITESPNTQNPTPNTPTSAQGATSSAPTSSTLNFVVPSWRPDIVREIDVVEEVGRVLGYEHIPELLPQGASTQGSVSPTFRFAERIRDLLTGAGLQEIVGHSLLAATEFEDPCTTDHRIAIRSALSAELSGLRRSLLPSLLDTLERNARRGNAPLAFFEIGNIFWKTSSGYHEHPALGGVLTGAIGPSSWEKSARSHTANFYTARGVIERVIDSLHLLPNGVDFVSSEDMRLHPGRSVNVLIDGDIAGFAGELHPRLTKELSVRERVIVFELSLAWLESAVEDARRYRSCFTPLTSFPAVSRDIAPRVPEGLPYSEVQRALAGMSIPILEDYDVTDLFAGSPLPEGTKSLTLSFTFRSPERTLTDADVTEALAQIRAALEAHCGATFPA